MNPAYSAFWEHLNSLQPPQYDSAYEPEEIQLMYETLSELQPDGVFEWGTNRGISARIYYEIVRSLGLDCPVHTFDLMSAFYRYAADGNWDALGECIKDTPVVFHQEDGVDGALRICEEQGLERPFFFLDGDHSSEAVRREMNAIYAAYPESPMLLHDTRDVHVRSGMNAGLNDIPDWYNRVDVQSVQGLTRLWHAA